VLLSWPARLGVHAHGVRQAVRKEGGLKCPDELAYTHIIICRAISEGTTLDVLVTHLARNLQFGVAEDKMMERLWGDNFFDPKTKKWTKKHTGTDTCQ
jgi:hypothetical protein